MSSKIPRRHLFISALAFSLLPALPGTSHAQSQQISGQYNAQGRNPDGSTYSGTVQLVESNGKVNMAWQVGSQNYSGTGVRDGAVVSVNWGADTPVIYVIMSNGALHGTWADGTALEKLTPR